MQPPQPSRCREGGVQLGRGSHKGNRKQSHPHLYFLSTAATPPEPLRHCEERSWAPRVLTHILPQPGCPGENSFRRVTP